MCSRFKQVRDANGKYPAVQTPPPPPPPPLTTDDGSFPSAHHKYDYLVVDYDEEEEDDYVYRRGRRVSSRRRASPRQILGKLSCAVPRCGSPRKSTRKSSNNKSREAIGDDDDDDDESHEQHPHSSHYYQSQRLVEDLFAAFDQQEQQREQDEDDIGEQLERSVARQERIDDVVDFVVTRSVSKGKLESIQEEERSESNDESPAPSDILPPLPPPSWRMQWADDDDDELVLFEHSVGDESSSYSSARILADLRSGKKKGSTGTHDSAKPTSSPDPSEDKTATLTDESMSEDNNKMNRSSAESNDDDDDDDADMVQQVQRVTTENKRGDQQPKIVDFNPVAVQDTHRLIKKMAQHIETANDPPQSDEARSIPSLMSRIEKLEAMLREEEACLMVESATSSVADGAPSDAAVNLSAATHSTAREFVEEKKTQEPARRPPLPRPPRPSPPRASPTSISGSSTAVPPSFSSMALGSTSNDNSNQEATTPRPSTPPPYAGPTPRPFFWRSHPGVTYTSYGPHQRPGKPVVSPRARYTSPSRRPFSYPDVMRRAHMTEGVVPGQGNTYHEPALGDWLGDEEERVSFFSDTFLQFDIKKVGSSEQHAPTPPLSISGSWVDVSSSTGFSEV